MWSCDHNFATAVGQSYQAAGPALYGAIQTFLTAQCLLAPDTFPDPKDSELERIAAQTYDFIVVGAGTAGSVVAHRLLEDTNHTVLLLEAGGGPTLGTEIPALFINNYGTKEDWNYRTEPQEKACLSYKDKRCYWPRGKVLGGTSSINGMYYIKGNKQDYNEWNVEDWYYPNIEKYFINSSYINQKPFLTSLNSNPYEGKMTLEQNDTHSIESMILKANAEIGIPFLEDINGEKQIGCGIAPTTTRGGERLSTFNVFLKPLKGNKRLTVLKHAVVEEILFEFNFAKGVKFHSTKNEFKKYEVKCHNEVILSAGTVNSAQILLQSGIGSGMKNNDVTLKVDMNVGENLQDHIFAPVMFKVKIKEKDDSYDLKVIWENYYKFITERKGPLADLRPQRVVSFINTKDASSDLPDIQNHFIVVYPNQSNLVDIFAQHKFSDEFYNAFQELHKNHLIIIAYVTLLQPKSVGKIEVEDNKPIIKANYLSNPEDLDTIVKGMRRVMKLAETKTFKDAGLELHWIELIECRIINTSDEYLRCMAKHLTGTLYHAVGTNRMGDVSDSNAVVDKELKVRMINHLRVIDASVMPKIVRGNTMAATLVIAEKGAELVKKDWSEKK